ncbi:hypothetical protein ACFL6M_04660 [Candidatus Eisenbacteria bacterium]|uniref:MotA/TolQ/ExbB proton channel domain-containing protein n=1 Tax=Eiseniibacteriota bacterium TaxID=2212470 RepID=A0ABV6YKL0_UNCEI
MNNTIPRPHAPFKGSALLTKRHSPFASIAATVAVAGFYVIHRLVLDPLPEGELVFGYFSLDAIRFKLFESGPIPYSILWTFVFGVTYLVLLWESRSSKLRAHTTSDRHILSAARRGDIDTLDSSIKDGLRIDGLGYLGERIALLFAHWRGEQSALPLAQYKEDLLVADEDALARSFAAVRWTEWLLPILGFLGTVAGIGYAIRDVGIGVEIIFRERMIVDAAHVQIQDGFKGLALAFDTTFLGLAGLALVGGLHIVARKFVAARLGQIRETLTDITSFWQSKDWGPPIIREIQLARKRTEQVHARLDSFSDLFLTIARKDPKLDHVWKVLAEPIITFDNAAERFVELTDEAVGKTIKGRWSYSAVAASSEPACKFAAAIAAGGKDIPGYVLLGDFKGNCKLTPLDFSPNRLWLSDNARLLVVSDEDSESCFAYDVDISGIGDLIPHDPQEIEPAPATGDVVCSLGPMGRDSLLMLTRSGPNPALYRFDGPDGRYPPPIQELDPGFRWSSMTVHQGTRMLVLLAQNRETKSWMIRLMAVPEAAAPETREESLRDVSGDLHLPSGIVPSEVLMLGRQVILFSTETGELYSWHLSRQSPAKFVHPDWHARGECILRPGLGGWFAVLAGGELSMWHASHDGDVRPYESPQTGFTVGPLQGRGFASTPDGQYLFGVRRQTIAAWQLPKTRQDGP